MTTEAGTSRHVMRIVVAITAPRRSRATLEMATALARSMHAELEALFVEESDLLGVADVAITRETDLASGLVRELDSTRMARALRAEAEHLKRSLTGLGSFGLSEPRVRVVRGRYGATVMEAATRVDIAFLHRGSRGASRSMHRPVWVVFDGSPASERALGVAVKIAAELRCALTTVITTSTTERGTALAARSRVLAGDAAGAMQVRTVPSSGPGTVAETAMAGGARLLVLTCEVAGEGDGRGAEWLAAVSIPVVLVT